MRAQDLPRVRDSLVSAHRRVLDRGLGDADEQAWMEHMLRILGVAELFFVAPAMVDLAVAGSDTVPDDALDAPDLLPAEAGLLVWGAPLPAARTDRGDQVSPRGMVWCRRAGGVDVTWLVDPGEHPDPMSPAWADVLLFPSTGTRMRHRLPEDAYGGARVARTAMATWLLMGQTVLVERRDLAVRAAGGAARRQRRTSPVTTVDLRAIYRPTVPPEDDTDQQRRRARSRWIVRGHWRSQPYGPGRTQRRPTWIAMHEKGPAGAPLVVTEKVMVWRR